MLIIKRLDAHDRLKKVQSQSDSISQYCQNFIDQAPFGNRPFYIFAHGRTIDLDEKMSIFNQDLFESQNNPLYLRKYSTLDQVPTDRVIWQPRLTKPKAQTNSMLFKGMPGSDIIETIWIIPKRELWEQYQKGNLTENETVITSIYNFINHRERLEAADDSDPTDDEVNSIYSHLSADAKRNKMMAKLYTKA